MDRRIDGLMDGPIDIHACLHMYIQLRKRYNYIRLLDRGLTPMTPKRTKKTFCCAHLTAKDGGRIFGLTQEPIQSHTYLQTVSITPVFSNVEHYNLRRSDVPSHMIYLHNPKPQILTGWVYI